MQKNINKKIPKKCISICKGKPTDECNTNEKCKYINGKTRKYCRLSYRYKMNKTNCNFTRKYKKSEAASMIRRFVNRNPVKIRREFLRTICSNSGQCLALGKESKKIRDYFEGFTEFHYLESPVKRIGAVSSNGFVNELKYNRGGYVSYAILKSSANSRADNLMYEYVVGRFINLMCERFPCFLETYGSYYYKDDSYWRAMSERKVNDKQFLKKSLKLEHNRNMNFGKACENSKHVAILIQHIKNVNTKSTQSIEGFLQNSTPEYIVSELPHLLYQIYFPLAMLMNVFTHYDLHQNNILLYELDAGKYIDFHYHLSNNEIISFKSKYIVKIIDYGRSYFYQTKTMNSEVIYKNLCKWKQCGPNCGSDFGFNWFSGILEEDNYFIDTSQPNISHDLRLLSDIRLDGTAGSLPVRNVHEKKINYFFRSLVYKSKFPSIDNDGDIVSYYGTAPLQNGYPHRIHTVNDAFTGLTDILKITELQIDHDSNYLGDLKIGDLHIYQENKPMEFIPFP